MIEQPKRQLAGSLFTAVSDQFSGLENTVISYQNKLQYRRLIHHGMTTFPSPDTMRYLGKPIPFSGDVPQRFTGDVVSDWKHRQEGVRIKHSVNGNSLKLYDKAFTVVGTVLRADGDHPQRRRPPRLSV